MLFNNKKVGCVTTKFYTVDCLADCLNMCMSFRFLGMIQPFCIYIDLDIKNILEIRYLLLSCIFKSKVGG